jgi:hypothetical protein
LPWPPSRKPSGFLDAFADFTIRYLDKLFSFFPLDMVTMHDDWGHERDTFFSEKMMEELVYEPTKRIVQYVKSKGAIFELQLLRQYHPLYPLRHRYGRRFSADSAPRRRYPRDERKIRRQNRL